MRITCPNCETSYQLAAGSLGATGRKVRCTRCGTTWQAMPAPEPPLDEASAEAEWEAVEKSASAEPTADDWKAALEEPKESAVRRVDHDGDDGDDPAGESDDEDTTDAMFDGAEGTGGEIVPFPGGRSFGPEEDTTETEEAADGGDEDALVAGGPAPTIEAEPAGFAPRARIKTRSAKSALARRANSSSAKLISGLVIGLAFAMVLATVGGALFARETVVRLVPDLAGLYALVGLEVNLRGLVFQETRTFREIDGSAPVLVVDGTVANVTGNARPVPRIRFGLTSTTGREVYAWTMEPVKAVLEPGETMFFRSRLPAPPEAATDVQVRFTDRRGP